MVASPTQSSPVILESDPLVETTEVIVESDTLVETPDVKVELDTVVETAKHSSDKMLSLSELISSFNAPTGDSSTISTKVFKNPFKNSILVTTIFCFLPSSLKYRTACLTDSFSIHRQDHFQKIICPKRTFRSCSVKLDLNSRGPNCKSVCKSVCTHRFQICCR